MMILVAAGFGATTSVARAGGAEVVANGVEAAAVDGSVSGSSVADSGSWRQRWAERVERFLADFGPWAPVVFVALFVVTSVLGIPGAVLTMVGGALFGVWLGLFYVWVGCVLGASAAFLVSRHVARAWVMRHVSKRPLLVAIEEAVTGEGWKIVALSRLAPGSPFFLLNYFYGLTRVGFWPYILATSVSLIPGSLLLVYLGSLGQMALAGQVRTPWQWTMYGVGLLALVGAVVLIARRAKAALKAKLAGGTRQGAGNGADRSG